jgi:predicted glycosyltransferase
MSQRTRIALYSHDTVGLGHVRRNLLIARALASSALNPAILMISGTVHANAFAAPPGVDSVTLPAIHKGADGRYDAGSLGLSLCRLVTLRSRTIRAALESFDPDLLIVDNVPRGLLGELLPTLAALKARGRARCVLGLRDILDEPAVVRREWHDTDNEGAIREYYAAVWVYGDRNVYDQAREYAFGPDVCSRMRYTGYLDHRWRLDRSQAPPVSVNRWFDLPPGRQILCTVGGGQDGGSVAAAFAAAEMPDGANGVVLTGPFMPRRTLLQVRRLARRNKRLVVFEFVSEAARLMHRADRVVTMGGYNTIAEVLSFAKPALVIPRVTPRREQLIRAEHLHRLGLVDILHPERLSPEAISDWLAQDRHTPAARATVDLGGLSRVAALAQELLDAHDVTSPLRAWTDMETQAR